MIQQTRSPKLPRIDKFGDKDKIFERENLRLNESQIIPSTDTKPIFNLVLKETNL